MFSHRVLGRKRRTGCQLVANGFVDNKCASQMDIVPHQSYSLFFFPLEIGTQQIHTVFERDSIKATTGDSNNPQESTARTSIFAMRRIAMSWGRGDEVLDFSGLLFFRTKGLQRRSSRPRSWHFTSESLQHIKLYICLLKLRRQTATTDKIVFKN